MAGRTWWSPAASWLRNFNGCFAAGNLKDSISGLCPELPFDPQWLQRQITARSGH
jgi:hypothetical protein